MIYLFLSIYCLISLSPPSSLKELPSLYRGDGKKKSSFHTSSFLKHLSSELSPFEMDFDCDTDIYDEHSSLSSSHLSMLPHFNAQMSFETDTYFEPDFYDTTSSDSNEESNLYISSSEESQSTSSHRSLIDLTSPSDSSQAPSFSQKDTRALDLTLSLQVVHKKTKAFLFIISDIAWNLFNKTRLPQLLYHTQQNFENSEDAICLPFEHPIQLHLKNQPIKLNRYSLHVIQNKFLFLTSFSADILLGLIQQGRLDELIYHTQQNFENSEDAICLPFEHSLQFETNTQPLALNLDALKKIKNGCQFLAYFSSDILLALLQKLKIDELIYQTQQNFANSQDPVYLPFEQTPLIFPLWTSYSSQILSKHA